MHPKERGLFERWRGRGVGGYPNRLLLLRGRGPMLVATNVESVEGVGDCKDTVRACVEVNVVVVCAATAAADGYLICKLGEEVVEVGERRSWDLAGSPGGTIGH